MRKYLEGVFSSLVLSVLFLGVVPVANAGDWSVNTNIVNVRSYLDGTYFVTVGSPALTTGQRCTTVYRVVGSAAGAKTIIATLLTAKATDSQIQVEMPTGCPDAWGSPIISVRVL